MPAGGHRALLLQKDGHDLGQECSRGSARAVSGCRSPRSRPAPGPGQVIGVDLEDNRLEFARRFGATHTVNPTNENLDEALAELTRGQGSDISVEAAGYPDSLNNAFKHVNQRGGKVIIFGIQGADGDGAVPLVFRGLFREGITVIPTQGATSGDAITHIRTMVELRARGWWDPGDMVTHEMAFGEVKRAYDMYENIADNVVKVVMAL